MVLVIAGAIPQVYGIWLGINLYRTSKQAIQKAFFINKVVTKDFTHFLTGELQLQIHSRSTLKTGGYFLVAGIQVVKLSRQKGRLVQALERLRSDWIYYHAATARDADLRSINLSFNSIRRVQLLGKNSFYCMKEGFAVLKMMVDLWDFCMGSDQERDHFAFSTLQGLSLEMMQKIDRLQLDADAIQIQLSILASMGKKMKITPFYGENPQLPSLTGKQVKLVDMIQGLLIPKEKYVPLRKGEKLVSENPELEVKARKNIPSGYEGCTKQGIFVLD